MITIAPAAKPRTQPPAQASRFKGWTPPIPLQRLENMLLKERLARTRAEAEDIVMDGVIKHLNRTLPCEPMTNPEGHLMVCVKRAALDAYRRSQRQNRAGMTAVEMVPDDVVTRSDGCFDQGECAQIMAAFALLTPEEQDLLRLHELEDRSFRDIEVLTGVPKSSAQSRHQKALDRLRELFVSSAA